MPGLVLSSFFLPFFLRTRSDYPAVRVVGFLSVYVLRSAKIRCALQWQTNNNGWHPLCPMVCGNREKPHDIPLT